MEISVENIKPSKLDTGPILQQSRFWAEIKDRQGWEPLAFEAHIIPDMAIQDSQNVSQKIVTDDMLMLTHQAGSNFEFGYVPYGPLYEPGEDDQGPFLEELSESIHQDLPGDCAFVRYDLHWESSWNGRESDPAKQHFELPSAEAREIRMNYQTRNWALRKAPTNILPSNTVFLDLTKSEDRLLKEMKPKTRYNIRLARRRGVTVREGGMNDLFSWYNIYRETTDRNSLKSDSVDYFRSVLEASEHNRDKKVKVLMLLAEIHGQLLAGMILVLAGGRATYLYGASSSENRNLMGSYALQWNAILKAKQAGCLEYDMFGISPDNDPGHPMYGLYRFKTGFGGEIFHRQGCWDYVFDKEKYEAYRANELVAQGYHL